MHFHFSFFFFSSYIFFSILLPTATNNMYPALLHINNNYDAKIPSCCTPPSPPAPRHMRDLRESSYAMMNDKLVLPKVQGIHETRKKKAKDGMVGIAHSKQKPIPSLRKMRRVQGRTNTPSTTALKYASAHFNTSFEKTSRQKLDEKINGKGDRAKRRKKRLESLKSNLDTNLGKMTNLSQQVVSELDKKSHTEKWVANLQSKHNLVALSSDGTSPFVRHRQSIQRMRVSSNPLSYHGMRERLSRMSFTLRNASNNLKHVAGSIGTALRKVSMSMPDARSILRGTNVSDAPHRDRNNRDMMGETSRESKRSHPL